jgi:hypothetical protein
VSSDNKPDEIENATHNTFAQQPGHFRVYPGLLCKCIVGCIFNCVGFIIIRKKKPVLSEKNTS